VGEETLAIALFCALHFQDNFRGGVLAAVNHGGDSDSTGAVTGNILGLLLGREAIPGEWVENLELAEVVAQVAADLYSAFQGASDREDTEWYDRYPPS
jgi:ADP-ribosylglycohydrolase